MGLFPVRKLEKQKRDLILISNSCRATLVPSWYHMGVDRTLQSIIDEIIGPMMQKLPEFPTFLPCDQTRL